MAPTGDDSPLISLREAVERYRRLLGAPANAYDWYRRGAQKDGTVQFGGVQVVATKIDRTWMVEETDVDKAFAAHQAAQEAIDRRTADYANHVLAGDGRTRWGGYRISGDFHFVWNDYERVTRGNSGAWYCNTCWEPASHERGREECHRCRDWSPCGQDCTVSRTFCPRCGTSLAR